MIGEPLSVVGHDGLPTSELLDAPLTTLRLDRRSVGGDVMARSSTSSTPPGHREFVELVERVSVGAPRLTTARGVANPPLV
jgi:DNA-binding LacI/PurR family transcriptional regulator